MRWRICSAAIACAAFVGACQARDSAAPAPAASDSPALTQLPVADPPLDREALLLAVLRAGSAAALGEEDSGQRKLDGKRFELRLRFGCAGQETTGAQTRGWTLDREGAAVRIQIDPEIDSETPLVQNFAGPDVEAVEGFWIPRPWQLKAGCPAPTANAPLEDAQASTITSEGAAAGPATYTDPALGIAQFFRETDARTHRRDRRAYEAAENLSEREGPSAAGYDLILHGRLQSLTDGKVIACRASPAEPPSCIISARFDEVSLERADTGEGLAEWPRG